MNAMHNFGANIVREILRRPTVPGILGGFLLLGTLLWLTPIGHSTNDALLQPLLVPKTSSAEDSGLRIQVIGATFSGTGTWVQLRVSATGDGALAEDRIANVNIPPDGFGSAGIRPLDAGDGLALRPRGGGPTILKFQTFDYGSEPTINIRALDVYLTTGGLKRVEGNWNLLLNVPSQRSDIMRLERLISGGPATSNGIEIAVLSASRSTSETSITVSVSSETPVVLLAEPRIIVDGKALVGGIVAQREDGRVLELSFPPTAFGRGFALELGPFVSGRQQSDVFSDIDFASVLARSQSGEGGRTSAPVLSADVRAPLDGVSPVKSIEISKVVSNGSETPVMMLTIAGNYEMSEGQTAVFPDGSEERALGSSSSYRKLPDGQILQGTTDVWFRLGERDRWERTIRVYHGTGTRILRGTWVLALHPE